MLIFCLNVPLASLAKVHYEITVSNVQQLREALEKVNETKLGGSIELEDGHYAISGSPLKITADHISIRSKSGVRDNVVLSGEDMENGLSTLIDVSANYFSIIGITLQKTKWHLIQIRAEHDADYFLMDNCVLQDSGQQLLKVSAGDSGSYSNFGIIKNSLFQYSAGIGPNYYIGGIDAHRSVDWLVQDNVFKYIASPANRVAQHAIHFWKDSRNIRTIGNLIINSDRGIGYGLSNSNNQSKGGVISSNTIIHTANSHRFADVGIVLESSPETVISNNVIFSTHTYPNAIEYRFDKTINVLISGNITNKVIKKRDGAQATLIENTTGGLTNQVIDNIQHLFKSTQ